MECSVLVVGFDTKPRGVAGYGSGTQKTLDTDTSLWSRETGKSILQKTDTKRCRPSTQHTAQSSQPQTEAGRETGERRERENERKRAEGERAVRNSSGALQTWSLAVLKTAT